MTWFRRIFRRRIQTEDQPQEGRYGGLPVAMRGGRMRAVGIPYALPRDLEEMNRLDFQHYLIRYALKHNYGAPITQPLSILDVGTGTGRWAREMAHLFPQANVVGLDITHPPADDAAATAAGAKIIPNNYVFVAGNVLEGLPFVDGSFDFVHMRLLVAGIPHDRWPKVIQELARVTRPGGWVESVESPSLERGGPATQHLIEWIRQLSLRREVHIEDGAQIAPLFAPAGLVNVRTHRVDLPCGDYGGRLGRMVVTNSISGTQGVAGLFVSQGLTTQEEFDAVLRQAQAEMRMPNNRCVLPFYIVYGQRPQW